MATSTSNLGLTLPSVNDAADIAVLNSNFQKIDGKIPSVGAAPATIVHKELKVASEAELDTALTAEVNTMWNNSVRFLVISPSSSALFGGIGMLCELYMRSSSGYATATFTGYGTTSPIIYHKTMWAGAWKPLVNGTPNAFAPSGYGLGENAPRIVSTPNDALLNGFYAVANDAYSGDGTFSDWRLGYAQLFVRRRGGSVLQNATYNDVEWFRCSTDSGATWQPWEWVNPPMQFGVEYRTTERYDGKPVYCKLVDCGALPDSTTKSVAYYGAATRIIRYSGEMRTTEQEFSLPYTMYNVNVCVQAITSHSINLYASYNASGFSAYVTVWYTKD